MKIPKPQRDPIIVSFPKDTNWHLPEGCYPAVISDIRLHEKETGSGTQKSLRFLFDVEIRRMANFICKAGKTLKLDLNTGSDLNNFLAGLFGKAYVQGLSGQKLNLTEKIGNNCEVQLTHFSGGDHDHPHVTVQKAVPPGTLNLTEELEGKD